jgi:hypothetical protein
MALSIKINRTTHRTSKTSFVWGRRCVEVARAGLHNLCELHSRNVIFKAAMDSQLGLRSSEQSYLMVLTNITMCLLLILISIRQVSHTPNTVCHYVTPGLVRKNDL